jgi:hypothetical protein
MIHLRDGSKEVRMSMNNHASHEKMSRERAKGTLLKKSWYRTNSVRPLNHYLKGGGAWPAGLHVSKRILQGES